MPKSFNIGSHEVGPNHPPFIIAEMSGNHNGDLERAKEIIRQCAATGVHAVKIQTYTADTMTIDVDDDRFRLSKSHPLWAGRSLYSLYDEAHTPWDWHEELFSLGSELGVIVFSTPFDSTAVDLLESLNAAVYKIASLEIIDLPLIRRVAATGKPVILSTGAATLAEIDQAVTAAREAGCEKLVVLGCTSSYPAPPEETNLRSIPVIATAFDVVVGLSDHTMGVAVSTAAIAIGARVIEKHVTLSREDGGVDSAFSLEPHELTDLVNGTREAFLALGTGKIEPSLAEAESQRFRRSLFVVKDVVAGQAVTEENVRAIRPSGGLEPDAITEVLGRTFVANYAAGTPVSWDLFSN